MKEIVAIAIDLLTAPFRKDTVTDVVKVLEGQVDKLFKISADRIATASTLRDKADVLHSQPTSTRKKPSAPCASPSASPT